MELVVINWQETTPGDFATPQAKARNFSYQLAQLHAYPQVQSKLLNTWGTALGRKVLMGLLLDDRDRFAYTVQGFPFNIVEVLNTLLELHDKKFAQYKPQEHTWDWERT